MYVIRLRHNRGVRTHTSLPESRDPKDVCDTEEDPDPGSLPATHEERHGWHHGELHDDPTLED